MKKEEIYIGGVKVNFGYRIEDVLAFVDKIVKDSGSFGHYICTTGPEFVITAQKDTEFKEIINNSDVSIPDGYGVVLARKYLETIGVRKYPKFLLYRIVWNFIIGMGIGVASFLHKDELNKEKITGVEIFKKITEVSAERKYKLFLLGGRKKDIVGRQDMSKDVSQELADKIRSIYPNIEIVGTTSQFNFQSSDDKNTLDYIHQCMNEKGISNIDILFIAYGHPHQEKWIIRNSKSIPVKISIGIGGTFDYLTGHIRECPLLIQRFGLEWLYRLFIQPWRIGRIFTAFPTFPFLVYKKSIDK